MNGQVDMLALARAEKEVSEGVLALSAVYGTNPPDAFYWKALLTFSYRLFVLDGVDEGMKLLATMPVQYFRTVLPQQMEDDPGFGELAKRVSAKLIEHRKVTPMYQYDSTKTNVQPGTGRA
jgi:hypothetical protein